MATTNTNTGAQAPLTAAESAVMRSLTLLGGDAPRAEVEALTALYLTLEGNTVSQDERVAAHAIIAMTELRSANGAGRLVAREEFDSAVAARLAADPLYGTSPDNGPPDNYFVGEKLKDRRVFQAVLGKLAEYRPELLASEAELFKGVQQLAKSYTNRRATLFGIYQKLAYLILFLDARPIRFGESLKGVRERGHAMTLAVADALIKDSAALVNAPALSDPNKLPKSQFETLKQLRALNEFGGPVTSSAIIDQVAQATGRSRSSVRGSISRDLRALVDKKLVAQDDDGYRELQS